MKLKNLSIDELKQLAKTYKKVCDTKRVQACKLQSAARVATREYKKLEDELDEVRGALKERQKQQFLQEGEWYKERERHNLLKILHITKKCGRIVGYKAFWINTKTNYLYVCDRQLELQDIASVKKLTKKDRVKYAVLIRSGATLLDDYSYKLQQNKITMTDTSLGQDEVASGKIKHKKLPIDWDPVMPEGNYR